MRSGSCAAIGDLRVRKLAHSVIEAQRREIREMNWLIDDIRENGKAMSEATAATRAVPAFEAAGVRCGAV